MAIWLASTRIAIIKRGGLSPELSLYGNTKKGGCQALPSTSLTTRHIVIDLVTDLKRWGVGVSPNDLRWNRDDVRFPFDLVEDFVRVIILFKDFILNLMTRTALSSGSSDDGVIIIFTTTEDNHDRSFDQLVFMGSIDDHAGVERLSQMSNAPERIATNDILKPVYLFGRSRV